MQSHAHIINVIRLRVQGILKGRVMEIRNLSNQINQSAPAKSENSSVNNTEQVSRKNEGTEEMKITSANERTGYTAVSKDGDTLEISDVKLASCSKGKLKQLLQNGQISKQQYEKAMKKLSTGKQ